MRRGESGGETSVVPSQQVGDHLAAVLIYDMPDSVLYIPQGLLDRWGVTFYEAMKTARENLVTMEAKVATANDGVAYLFTTDDGHDVSRLLMLDAIRSLDVDGDHIAMVPNHDTLIVTGSNERDGLAMMARDAEKALADHRPLCAIPMRLVDDEWESWMPERDDPLYQKFKLLAIKSLGKEYGAQKELLDKLHEQAGEGEYIAEYNAIKHDAHGHQSYCVWTEGIDSLLPQADRVFFGRVNLDGDDGKPLGTMEWEQVQAEFGDLMEPLDVYPPRFRVREFPQLPPDGFGLDEFLLNE